MPRTIHRLTLALTKEDQFELEFLMDKFGESKNQVYRRALTILYNLTLQQDQGQNNVGEHSL
jgi:hypothetical protein